VVVDGNRITGAGVTSGLDFAFTVLAALRGAEAAQTLQLLLEYDPHPPFDSGHPRVAAPELVEKVRRMAEGMLRERLEVSSRVAQRMGATMRK
jgi:cyclohexyl-isocyanide hydratase